MHTFTIQDPDGGVRELTPGLPFISYRQRVDEEQEAVWSGLPIGEFALVEIGHAGDALLTYSEDQLTRFGITKVEVEAPEPTLEQLAAGKRTLIDMQYAGRMLAGFPVPGHPGERLQLRNNDDRTNWLTLQARSEKRCRAGDGAELCPLPIRTMGNTNLDGLTYDQVCELLDVLLDWAAALLEHRWELKDAVKAAYEAQDATAIAAVDETQGWPS